MPRMPCHPSPPPGSCRSWGLRGPGRHTVPAGAQRVPPHRPRKVHLPPPAPSLGPDTFGLMAGIFYSLSVRRSSRSVGGEGLLFRLGACCFLKQPASSFLRPLLVYVHVFSTCGYTSQWVSLLGCPLPFPSREGSDERPRPQLPPRRAVRRHLQPPLRRYEPIPGHCRWSGSGGSFTVVYPCLKTKAPLCAFTLTLALNQHTTQLKGLLPFYFYPSQGTCWGGGSLSYPWQMK